MDEDDPWDEDDFVGGAIPEAARRAATPQAVREWVEQVSQQLARDERRQRDEARETIRRQELRRRRPATRSQTAEIAAQPEEGDQCRICFSGAEDGKLIAPCKCAGTQRYVHEECLRKWQRTCAGTVWKSDDAAVTPSSRRRVDGVEVERAVSLISTQVLARGKPSTAASAARGLIWRRRRSPTLHGCGASRRGSCGTRRRLSSLCWERRPAWRGRSC